jgi:glycerophosphoryl diester phosphodiesterase
VLIIVLAVSAKPALPVLHIGENRINKHADACRGSGFRANVGLQTLKESTLSKQRTIPYLQSDQKPLVFAHRGASGRLPENTIPAFQMAADMGVDGLELDIHSTVDGVLVTAHDEELDRISDGTGLIREKTWAEVRQADAGYWFSADNDAPFPLRNQGYTLPSLEEMFERFGHLRLNIDIKQREPSIVAPFAALIRRFGLAQNVMVGSFYDDTLAAFRQLAPDIPTSASPSEVRRFIKLNLVGLSRLFRTQAYAFQVPETHGRWRIVSPRSVRNLHKLGLHVHVWTVNDEADMRRLIEWGVDGIMSDYPGKLMQVAGRMVSG